MRSTGAGIVSLEAGALNGKTSSHCANRLLKVAPMTHEPQRGRRGNEADSACNRRVPPPHVGGNKTLGWAVVAVFLCHLAGAIETQRVYLSGHGKDDTVPWRFMCTTGALSGFWTNIPVPSNWDVKGFGHLTYKKDYSNAITECGLYEKEFAAPKKWKDKRVFLVFEGAMTDTTAKLNGQVVGPTHQGGFYRFKYDVTDKLKLGAENKLEVTVAKHSANESVNRAERLADYWVFGGIYRPVYLEVTPKQFIERVAIDARADGSFAMEVFLNGVTDADEVEAQIVTLGGKKVSGVVAAGILAAVEPGFQPGGKNGTNDSASSGVSKASVQSAQNPGGRMPPSTAGKMPAATIKAQVGSPKLWSAETPNLYRVEVRLKRGKEVLHQFTEQFGFRTFEVRDGDGLYLNGQKIILKGVNRHSFWPDSGRCLSEAVHRLDITTIKEMNGNAVRMSHYPPDLEFLDLCDELGLYVLDEIGGWQKFYDTDIGTKIVEETVTRDVNHPSILFWDNGNEGGFNTNLDHVFGEFDIQKRRVLHPWATFSGINTSHYLAHDKAEVACAGIKTYYADGKEHVVTNDPARYIYMPTEFIHGLYDGGAGAGLEDYWSMMMKSPLCAGGFIWVFADEGIKRPDTGQIDVAGNQAPDGIVGPYREREGSFYAIREIWGSKTNKPTATKSWPLMMKPGVEVVKSVEGFGDERASSLLQAGEMRAFISGKNGALLAVEKHGKRFALNGGPRLAMTNAAFTKLAWQIRKDGWLQCDFAYTATGTQDVFGVVFDYPENLVQKKRWLGDGPFRVWKNRLGGVTFGEWANNYNNTITGYSEWKYPDFKGCFSNVRWLQLETTEGLITVVPENIPFVQVLTPEQPPDNLVAYTKVNLPRCGLGLLHAIPPIGTKFKPAAQGGPQGQPNVGRGEYSGRVSFYFGKLP
jgi:hypothetical protein